MQNSIRTRRYDLPKLEIFRFLEQKIEKSTFVWFSLGWILYFFDEKMMIFLLETVFILFKMCSNFQDMFYSWVEHVGRVWSRSDNYNYVFHRYFLLKPDFLYRSTFLRPEVQKCWEMEKSCKIEKIMIFQILLEIFTNKFALAPSKPVLSILSKTSLGT